MIQLSNEPKTIELLYFFYDPIVIDTVTKDSIVLDKNIKKLPKPLNKFRLKQINTKKII
jgi:hypothetical protein